MTFHPHIIYSLNVKPDFYMGSTKPQGQNSLLLIQELLHQNMLVEKTGGKMWLLYRMLQIHKYNRVFEKLTHHSPVLRGF